MQTRNYYYIAAIVLLWLLFAQAVRGAVISSITFDEGPHLATGYATLRTGDFRLQPVHIHPPLVNVLAAAPLLLDPSLPDPRSIGGWDAQRASLSAITDETIWKHRPQDTIAFAGRLPIILLAVLLGAFVYHWASDLAGRKAGLLALFLYALDPNIVAHSQVITTDMGVTVFGFVALYCCFKYQTPNVKRQTWWLVGIGAALGAALATKVSAGLLAPLVAVTILLIGPGSIARRIGHIALIGLIAFAVVWATYGFQIDRVPGLSFPIPAATHVKIYQSLQQHYDEGHPSFLMGMNSTRGWWFYFPIAFLIKTPLPVLILLVASLVLAFRPQTADRRPRPVIGDQLSVIGRRWLAIWTLGLFPMVHFATALFSSVDIGYRHLVPMLPFLFVFVGWQVAGRQSQDIANSKQMAPRFTFHVLRFTFYALLAWYAISAALIFPHNLAYFNEIAGGPDGGYNWLVDSNLDWGQNLKELKAWMDARGVSEVYISQFSPSRPEAYGIQAKMLLPSPRAVPFAPFDPAPGWYAIGATTLQGVYMPDTDTFAYFHAMTPTARIGHALFVYHVPEQLRGEWVAQCASPSPPFSAEEIESGFGRRDMRQVIFDCSNSWWYPAGEPPGWYVGSHWDDLKSVVRMNYPSVNKVYQPRGKRAEVATVYYIEFPASSPASTRKNLRAAPGDWLPARAMEHGTQMTTPVTTTGPLRFEFFSTGFPPQLGQPMFFNTRWQVTRSADYPLSIMAHLLDAQGRVVAGGDGLGVPIEVWQAGDVIRQTHRLDLPRDLAPGTYWIETGIYRLDTMERYRILQGDQAIGDRLLLASVEVKP